MQAYRKDTIPVHDRPFKLHSKVVRFEKDGVAIQFDKMTVYHVVPDVCFGVRRQWGWIHFFAGSADLKVFLPPANTTAEL